MLNVKMMQTGGRDVMVMEIKGLDIVDIQGRHVGIVSEWIRRVLPVL